MNTCSNCGAAVRPGAKFCTACGTRLNDVSASTATSEWTAGQPASDTTRVVEVTETAGHENTAGNGFSASNTVPARGTSEDESPQESSSWSWRSSPSDPTSSVPVSVTDEGDDVTTEPSSGAEPRVFIVDKRDEAPASTSAPSNTTDTDASAEEFTWTWGTPESLEPTADDETATSITDAERDAANRVADDDTPLTMEPATEPFAPMRHDQEESFSLPEDADAWSSTRSNSNESYARAARNVPGQGTTGVDGAPDLSLEPHSPEAVDATAGSAQADNTVDTTGEPGAEDEDPLDRARRLVEELRTLIPPPRPYGKHDPQAASAPLAGLRDELESARSTSDFGDLRSALESARERPRDVDTMLAMVNRIDTMLEALDDRDRLASAIDRAIALLEPDASMSTG